MKSSQEEDRYPAYQKIKVCIVSGKQLYPKICLGYLWDEKGTRELIDDDGWVHSGESLKRSIDIYKNVYLPFFFFSFVFW